MCKGPEAESSGDLGVIEGRDAVSKKEAWYQGQPGVRMHEYCKEFGFYSKYNKVSLEDFKLIYVFKRQTHKNLNGNKLFPLCGLGQWFTKDGSLSPASPENLQTCRLHPRSTTSEILGARPCDVLISLSEI